jgi:hypothetical protein
MLQTRYVVSQQKIKEILKDRYFAITTDSWTSTANHGYVTCTAHFVNKDTWTLHSLVLGIFQKDGASTAQDTVTYVENQMALFELQYKYMVATVTDTDTTMISAGQIFVSNSIEQGSATNWHGCVYHLLELVNCIAFKDSQESEGTMRACNFFNSSSQAMAKLLSKQSVGRAVKPIQDVSTCWWITWSMCDRLIRLKTCLTLLQEEGELTCNLKAIQWVIVTELQSCLHPFMVAQKPLEGQAYVTISLVPYIIYKVRSNLTALKNSPDSSPHVLSIAFRMLEKMDELFGSGAEGTVAAYVLP